MVNMDTSCIFEIRTQLIITKKNFDEKIFYLLLRPMKIVPGKIFNAIVLFCAPVFAAPGGPPPPAIPPPGLPIDGGVLTLGILAIGYGIYKINQIKLNKKTPV